MGKLRATAGPQKVGVKFTPAGTGGGGGLSPEGTNMLGCGTGTGGGKEEEAASQVGVTGAPNQGGRGKRTPLLPRKQWGLGGKRGADQTGTLFPNR